MKITRLPINGLMLIDLDLYTDARGFFVERFNSKKHKELDLPTEFAQDNHSRSRPGVLRGLHYQKGQGKLVGVMRGRIWDVVVDIRTDSPTYGQHFGLELNSEVPQLFWIPDGFAHGFCVLGDEPADIVYKVTTLYDPNLESGFHWADPALNISWPIKDPIVSKRDQELQSFQGTRNLSDVGVWNEVSRT